MDIFRIENSLTDLDQQVSEKYGPPSMLPCPLSP